MTAPAGNVLSQAALAKIKNYPDLKEFGVISLTPLASGVRFQLSRGVVSVNFTTGAVTGKGLEQEIKELVAAINRKYGVKPPPGARDLAALSSTAPGIDATGSPIPLSRKVASYLGLPPGKSLKDYTTKPTSGKGRKTRKGKRKSRKMSRRRRQ